MTDESNPGATKSEDDKETGSTWLPFLGIVALIISVQMLFTFAIVSYPSKWETKAQFGDMSGWLNTMFSGFAFAGVIYAIVLQRKELILQREELRLTRREMSRAADAQIESAKSQMVQNQIGIHRALIDAYQKAAEISALRGEREDGFGTRNVFQRDPNRVNAEKQIKLLIKYLNVERKESAQD